jgi:hypothetical protein
MLWISKWMGTTDPTYNLSSITEWSSVEVNAAIVCACVTTLKPLWRKAVPSRKTRLGSNDGSSGSRKQANRPMTIGSARSGPVLQTPECGVPETDRWPPVTATFPKDNGRIIYKSEVLPMGILDTHHGDSRTTDEVKSTAAFESSLERGTHTIEKGDESPILRASSNWSSKSDREGR